MTSFQNYTHSGKQDIPEFSRYPKKTIRVAHISYSDIRGGASVAASRIHQSLQARPGIYSEMHVINRYSDQQGIIEIPLIYKLIAKLTSILSRALVSLLCVEESGEYLSLPFGSCLFSHYLNKLDADIIHLHWVQGGLLPLANLSKVTKPIVWTLHDMWPIYGCEHYTKEMPSWRFSKLIKPCRKMILRNSKYIGLYHCTTQWMAMQLKSSRCTSEVPIQVIPYPLPLKVFYRHNRDECRRLFQFSENETILLYGAINASKDRRKGFDLLLTSLSYIDQKEFNIRLVVFGSSSRGENIANPSLPVNISYLPQITSSRTLAKLYSSADIMIIPSRIEAFGQTASEAQSCGLPCIAFDNSGLSEVISQGKTGLLVPYPDIQKLSFAIESLIKDPILRQTISTSAIRRSNLIWSEEVVSAQLVKAYFSLISSSSSFQDNENYI